MSLINWYNYLNDISLVAIPIKRISDIKDYCGIYGPPRGGSIFAGLLSHELERYDIHLPIIDRITFPGSLRSRKLLVVDEINDTGATLKNIKDKWENHYDMTFITLCSRYNSCFESNINVRTINHDNWIVFPYEVEPKKPEINWVRY